jgi:hypothetical protein
MAGVAGGKPIVAGAYTHAKADSEMIKEAQVAVRDIRGSRLYHNIEPVIQPSPLWIVEHEARKQTSDRERSLNTKIYRSPVASPNVNLDVKYGMTVKVNPLRKVCSWQFLSWMWTH